MAGLVTDLVRRARAAGIRFRLLPDRWQYTAPESGAELVTELRSRKADVLRALRSELEPRRENSARPAWSRAAWADALLLGLDIRPGDPVTVDHLRALWRAAGEEHSDDALRAQLVQGVEVGALRARGANLSTESEHRPAHLATAGDLVRALDPRAALALLLRRAGGSARLSMLRAEIGEDRVDDALDDLLASDVVRIEQAGLATLAEHEHEQEPTR